MPAEIAVLLPIALAAAVAGALAGAAWERRRAAVRAAPWRDPATGLPGPLALLEALAQQLALAARRGDPVAVLRLEVDGPAGAERMREVARRLSRRMRGHDLLGRWGDTGFLALLPGSDAGAALVLAQDLIDRVARSDSAPAGPPLQVTLSAGVHALRPEPRDPVREQARAMVEAAGRALAATAAQGPGRIAVEP